MNTPKLALALFMLTATACDQTPSTDPSLPDAYALQLPLKPAAGGALQRLALPAEALGTVRRADFGDIRLFDSRGKLVPIALVEQRADDTRRSVTVPVYPVVGSVGTLGDSGLSIRIEGNNVARVVTVDSAAPAIGNTAPPAAVLLDTRSLRETATAIALDADIPAGKPITLTLRTSANLKDWEPLAEKILFRPGDGQALLGGATVALPGINLRDRYVGISWGGASGVMLKGARVITSSAAPPTRTAVAASAMSLADAHKLSFDLPHLARLAAMRLTVAASDGVIPVKLFGRDHAQDLWTLLSATTLRPDYGANLLDLSGPTMTSYQIVADRRTGGFSAPPTLELLFDPVELLVALSGTPPYRLAVGQGTAPATYLTLAEIAPQESPLKLAALPQGKLAVPNGPPLVVTLRTGASDGALDPRKLILWAALLLGTMILAFAALRLMRLAAPDAAAKDE